MYKISVIKTVLLAYVRKILKLMCLKFDTIFLFRTFKFFIMPYHPGSLKINIQYEYQETGIFFIFFAESG